MSARTHRIAVAIWASLFVAVGWMGPARAQGPLTGKLIGRIAIRGTSPPNVSIRVKLLQSFLDLRPYSLAGQKFVANGSVTSLAYELNYDVSLIDPDGVYYVDALGTVDGQIGWVTQGDTYVLTRGYPTTRLNITLIPLKQTQLTPVSATAASMMDVIEADPSLGTLSGLLKEAGMADALDNSNVQSTLFAPTDDAFAKLPAGQLDALRTQPDKLRALLRYHQTPGRLMSKIVMAQPDLNTLQDDARIQVMGSPNAIRLNNTANVVRPNLVARNGVIHVIDAVLTR